MAGGRAVGSGQTFEHEGRALTALGWAEVTGLPLNTVYMRLAAVRRGDWTMTEAVTLPRGAKRMRPRTKATPAPVKQRMYVRRSKETGQLEDLAPARRVAAADDRLEAEIRKLRALVVRDRRRHVDCDCAACLPPTY